MQASQEVSHFPAGDLKAAMKSQKGMTSIKRKRQNNFQKKHHLGTVSKNIFTGGLKYFTVLTSP